MVIGDFGNGSEAQLAVRDLIREVAREARLWITVGDNAYPDGTHAEFQDHVFDIYADDWATRPVCPVPGNHDYKTDRAQPYLDSFVLPEVAYQAVDHERYYDADFGALHLAALDSQEAMFRVRPEQPDVDQLDWLEADMAEVEGRWKLTSWHYPPYSGQPGRSPDAFAWAYLRPAVEALEVDLALTGHNHMYERFSHIRDDARAELGTTYIVTGGGGAGLYEIGSHPLQDVSEGSHHVLVLHATATRLEGIAYGVDGEELDRFALER